MTIVRTLSPYSPAAAFPMLKLATVSDFCANDQQINDTLAQAKAVGWTVVDYGPADQYHYDDIFRWVGPIPNGFHLEQPSVTPFNRFDPRTLMAIVPDGQTREALGV